MIDTKNIIITPEILALIGELDEFKGAWQLLGKLSPDTLNILRKVATIESIGSSTRIEGSRLTDKQIEELLAHIQTYSFVSRDEQEVAGYAHACQEILESYEHMTFSENLIKQLHKWLLEYSEKDERHRGEYKKLPNHVEAFDHTGKSLGIIFETASPFETPFRMSELIEWTQDTLLHKQLHPLLIIGIFVVVFLDIHPFQDGNGRLSRLITTLLLMQNGYSYVAYSSLESVIEHNKEGYYRSLRKTQTSFKKERPDWNAWLLFFLRSLQKQKTHLEQKVTYEKMTRLYVPETSHAILSVLSKRGMITISELETITTINRNTLKKHLALLVKEKTICRHGKGRGTWYTLI